MSVLSAKNGVVTWETVAVADATDITVNLDGDPKVYASSSTAGNRSRVAGHKDAEGSFTLKTDAMAGTMEEGAIGTLLLESVTGTTLFSGEALIGSISYSVPIESGEIVEATVTWGQANYPT